MTVAWISMVLSTFLVTLVLMDKSEFQKRDYDEVLFTFKLTGKVVGQYSFISLNRWPMNIAVVCIQWRSGQDVREAGGLYIYLNARITAKSLTNNYNSILNGGNTTYKARAT